jgi:hypothetical protein
LAGGKITNSAAKKKHGRAPFDFNQTLTAEELQGAESTRYTYLEGMKKDGRSRDMHVPVKKFFGLFRSQHLQTPEGLYCVVK